MEDIRKTMGGETGGMDAPWDSKGRPLGKGGGMGSMGSMGGMGSMGSSRLLSSTLGSDNNTFGSGSGGGSKDTK